eukprot:NODE_1692_length_1331_cov_128.248050_g1406_i0.p2 GENE.NODE_1692_length_1331_cov_128.248050_g1406_i0~~NODE_1692_length_1331_cov_128.248050_g1406_i0.p2  ORF type:complete len:369 (-),score=87.78 NODE_1692_length_1331_cov_128.248050_g1406_i0:72-1178(-)
MSGSTKHRPQNFSGWGPMDQEPESVQGHTGTVLDDMKVQKYVCLPLKPQKPVESAITFGDDPVDYTRDRFPGLPGETETLDARRARARDMNGRHFEFGDAAFQGKDPMRAPTRDELLARNIRPIGCPNNKGNGNVFISPEDAEAWRHDLVSEMRRNFLSPDAPRADPKKAISKDMNATHFQLGEEPANYDRKQFVACTARPERAPNENHFSSIPLADKGAPEWCPTNRGAFSAPVGAERPQLCQAPATNIVLGTDPKELKTTQRGSYKQPKYVDCEAYTDAELKALGLVRFLVQDVPDQYKTTPEYSKALRDLQDHKEVRRQKMAGAEGTEFAESQRVVAAPANLPAPAYGGPAAPGGAPPPGGCADF